MPELSDDMYCSQQIMVPPMFPYLLRQYAKAAIRSQPADLLRWSTAYFRCLSLNLPPPVKPRLEYPIPRDYEGITPGWLRALLYQFHGSAFVDFKVLWDRWIGACLQHGTLVKILCLGGFDDPDRIPFLRFLSLCCAFISENLTQTMILICEVLTDEPEGGSAMIVGEVFVDLYQFLAAIDASEQRTLLNRRFTDRALGLIEKRKVREAAAAISKPPTPEKEPSAKSETTTEEPPPVDERKEEVSCPDLVEVARASVNTTDRNSIRTVESDASLMKDEQSATVPTPVMGETESAVTGEEVTASVSKVTASVSKVTQSEDAALAEDLNEDITKYLEQIQETVVEEAPEPPSPSTLDLPTDKEVREVESYESFEKEEAVEEEEEESTSDIDKFVVEEVTVEPIPGIGAVVPPELVETVVQYVRKCAAAQNDMIMPRNVRHYSCPPLEVLD